MDSVKRFGLWFVGAVVAFFISHGKGNYLILGIYLVASLIIYIVDCFRAPMRRCVRCRGTGDRRGFLFLTDTGACPSCNRSGRQPRVGTKILNLPRH